MVALVAGVLAPSLPPRATLPAATAAAAPAEPVAPLATPVVEAPAPPIADAPRDETPPAVLTSARLVVAAPVAHRPSRRAMRRVGLKRATRPFDWSVYERKTRPQFADAAGPQGPSSLF